MEDSAAVVLVDEQMRKDCSIQFAWVSARHTVSADWWPKGYGCLLLVSSLAVGAAVAGIDSQIHSFAERMGCSYQKQSAVAGRSVAAADNLAAAAGIETGRIPFAVVGSHSEILSADFGIP